MKYKVKIVKTPKYEMGGEDVQSTDNQIIQLIQAYAQSKGIDPQQLVSQLQQMDEENQKQTIIQMYQELQGGDNQTQPEMAAYGGQMGYGLDLGARRLWMNQDGDESSKTNKTIKEVPREYANIEAEGGETIVIPGDNGMNQHFNIEGNRHTNGGVPLNVPEESFVFSDTKKMKLGGSVLKLFGKSEKSSKKFTPADLAKQYDLNKYTSVLEDPNADALKKRTAELMIQNYNKKLAQLALVQEGKKGYPQGIPKIAQEYFSKMTQASDIESKENTSNPIMKFGGGLKKYAGDEDGSEVSSYYKNWHPPMVAPITQVPVNNSNMFYGEEPIHSSYGLKETKIGNKNNKRPEMTRLDMSKYSPNPEKIDIASPEEIDYPDYSKEIAIDNTKPVVNKSNIKYGWTNPDKLNYLNSLINLATVKKYDPFEPTMKFQKPEVSFLDPSRALAANAEQMNASRQAAGMFAGPQSRYSFNAGQYGKNAADIIGQYANQNISIGNQASQIAANTANQQAQFDTQRAKRLYDAGVIGEQQYQNAIRQARTGVLQAYTQGSRNAADIYNMNMTESPYFATRPGTNTIYFHSPKAMSDYFNNNSTETSNKSPKQLLEEAKAAGYTNVKDYLAALNYNEKQNKARSNKKTYSFQDDED